MRPPERSPNPATIPHAPQGGDEAEAASNRAVKVEPAWAGKSEDCPDALATYPMKGVRNMHDYEQKLSRVNELLREAKMRSLTVDENRELGRKVAELEDAQLEQRITDLGRAMSKGGGATSPAGPRYKDAAAALVNDERFIEWRKSPRDSKPVEVEFKDGPTDVSTDNADITQHWLPGIVGPVTFPMNVAGLFSQAVMDGASVSYLTTAGAGSGDDGPDGAAGFTAIASQKAGPATLSLAGNQVFAKKSTATMIVPEESLEDLPALEGQLRSLLLTGPEGLAYVIEDGLLNGSDSGDDLNGVFNLSPDEQNLAAGGDRLSKRIFAAATEIANAGFAPDAAVINPIDAYGLHVEEDDISRPLWTAGGPYGSTGLTVPIVLSRKIMQGTVLVGAFKESIKFTRKAVSIRASAEGLGLADVNLVLFVAETRLALAHPRGADPYRTVTISS